MNSNIFAKANQIIKKCGAVYIGVIDGDGFPMVSTISQIKPESVFEAYFATGTRSHKYKCLQKNTRASVCYHSGGDNVTLVGDIEILTDQPTKSQFWLEDFIDFYPLGETDPLYCVLKFTTKYVILWIDNESAEFSIEELLTVQSRCGLLCKWCAYKESHNCGGCVETNGRPFHGECPVAKCCQDRGHAHCGECSDMPCTLLRQYSCDDPEHGDNPPGSRIEVLKAWAAKVCTANK